MLESAFKLIVMFFRLTNSLVTFQIMMNDLLKDMIEARDVAAFINDVMVETETETEKEKGYDDIVEKVLSLIVKNDLFVKLEKYVLKIREFGLFGVVIGPDKVKMKKEKV